MLKKKFALFLLISGYGSIAFLKAQTSFTEVAQATGIDHFYSSSLYIGGGVAWFDYDNDGDEDAWITGGSNQDKLFQNQGDGTFLNVGTAAGLAATNGYITTGVVTGDIDNDGHRDVFVCTGKGFHNLIFRNNGDGTFTEISATAGITADLPLSTVASFGDINLDGYLDLYVGNYIATNEVVLDSNNIPIGFAHTCFKNLLYLNNGDLTFTEIAQSFALADTGCALGVTLTDYDQDHDADILVANDFGAWKQANRLFRNNQRGNSFTDVSSSSQMDAEMFGMGIAIGDYDQDLDLDYYVTNLGRNGLFQNEGNGSFTDITTAAGVEDTYEGLSFTVGWGCSFRDVDNDTDLDLWVTNGYIPAADFIATNPNNPDRLFLNEGDGTFVDYSSQADINYPSKGRGSAAADYDQDGDIDFIVVPINKIGTGDPTENILFHRNDLNNDNHWLQVKLEGTINNRDAYGSLIKIVLADRSWIYEISGGSSHGSQNSSIAHFGLGSHLRADSLIITWPGGEEQILLDIMADQQINVLEDTALYTSSFFKPKERLFIKNYPNPFTDITRIEYLLTKSKNVDISIYNIQGQKIRTLLHANQHPGTHQVSWNGMDKQGKKVSSGMFIARVSIGNISQALRIHVESP